MFGKVEKIALLVVLIIVGVIVYLNPQEFGLKPKPAAAESAAADVDVVHDTELPQNDEL